MQIIADLHVHSKHSRATSYNLSIENLEKYGRIKGLDLIGTGDFQHPLHRKEIDEKLKEDDKGILRTASGFAFILQTEISLMYSQDGKGRAIHLVVLAPNTETANKITDYLVSKGRIDYDGRPIFGIPCPQFVEDLKAIDNKIEIIPAHCLLPNEKIICNPKPKLISNVEIGDNVLTHTGNYKKVKEVLVHPYKGKVYKIQPYYFREEEGINTTSEHPFLAIKTVKNCSYIGGLCKPNSIAKGKHECKKKHYEEYEPKWIYAENLEVNDVLLYPRQKKIVDLDNIKLFSLLSGEDYRVIGDFIVPISGRQDKKIKNIIKITPNFCRLIGYYLAEGYIVKKNNCLQFAFAEHEEEYVEDVIALMKECFGIELAKKRERHGYELYFYSKVLVDLFGKLFYENSKSKRSFSKRLPIWALYLSKGKQAEIFRGWWRGDAGVTTSEILATQMKIICLRLSIIPSVYKKTKEEHNKREPKHKGRIIKANSDYYFLQNLSFFEDNYSLLDDFSLKKFKTKLARKHGWIDEDYVYIPIRKIETRDYEGDVYNLEVEEDNSFVTPSATVHNCMTPWFGLFGSKKGFNSLKQCFQEQVGHIYAIESGMSADPQMLWRFKEKINVVSFSDAHSHWPWRIGREATIFEIPELSYAHIVKAIRTGIGLKATVETPPAYGKYHWDGHRNCNFSCSPEKTKQLKGICPVCKNLLTIGVDNRVEEISKESKEYKPENAKPFYLLLPLHELIALHLGSTLASKRTWDVYNNMIEQFGNEFNILLNVSKDEMIKKNVNEKLIELTLKNREGKIRVKPGFDGEYGKVLFEEEQSTLF